MILFGTRVITRSSIVYSRLSRSVTSNESGKFFSISHCREDQLYIQGPRHRQFAAQIYTAKEELALKRCLALVRSKKRLKDQPESADEAEFNRKIEVDPPLLRFLVGKGGEVKRKIENDTGVKLQIPSPKEAQAGKMVEIQGVSEDAVGIAAEQVHKIVDEVIDDPLLQYTHFVSIPLALHPMLLKSVTEFQEAVLESVTSSSDDSGTSNKGIDKSIFVKPATFHLTILMLKLWSERRVEDAVVALQKAMPRVHAALDGIPLSIKLTGVDCMKGNPAKAHVLFADVEADDQAERLLKAGQIIKETFAEADLVSLKDQLQSLKLHATLMNTCHRASGVKDRRFRRRIPFDATDIMGKYMFYQWGEYHVSEMQLSKRFVYDESGYYHCCSSIPLP